MLEDSGTTGRARTRTATLGNVVRGNDGDDASPRAWRLVALLIAALLLAIVVMGLLAVNENNRVNDITTRALSFDVEVEDEGDDIRIAILDLRHVHRNIVFSNSTASTVADFDDAFAALVEEMGELEELNLGAMGWSQPERIRELAERYYADFRPVIDRAGDDPRAFQVASDLGLSRLAAMGDAAGDIDELGEQLAEQSLLRVESAARTEQFMLVGLISGALVIGVVLVIAATRVLSRLRTLYEREQRSRRALARALQTKTDFVADASHELRTPLAVILGNAETALGGPGEHLHETALGAIAAEARRMGKLVDDLLFLARSDSGGAPIDKEYVPARWLVARVVKPAEMLAHQRDARFAAEVGGGGYLDADPERIEQAVLILVDNAARHNPPNGQVTLSSRIEEGQFVIEVADTGPGIAPDELPLIFDRFYQVKNRRGRKKDGSGLGLSIARTIVAAHGGTIVAASTPCKGTRMTIRLPLSTPPVVDEPLVVGGRQSVTSS